MLETTRLLERGALVAKRLDQRRALVPREKELSVVGFQFDDTVPVTSKFPETEALVSCRSGDNERVSAPLAPPSVRTIWLAVPVSDRSKASEEVLPKVRNETASS